mgnify:CR=1 FL=1
MAYELRSTGPLLDFDGVTFGPTFGQGCRGPVQERRHEDGQGDGKEYTDTTYRGERADADTGPPGAAHRRVAVAPMDGPKGMEQQGPPRLG